MALTDSLISYWKLDEASGNALDAHGANTLTDNNSVGTAVGKIGNARDFELDSAQYFSRADNADLSTGDIDFTFAFWAKPETLAVTGNVIAKDNLGPREHRTLLLTTGVIQFIVYTAAGTTSGSVSSTPTLSAGTWGFVVVWHDATANTINVQINNGTVDSTSYSSGVEDTAADFTIGARAAGGGPYDGLIDEVGFWKRVLTSNERTALYNNGNGFAYPFTVATTTRVGRVPRNTMSPVGRTQRRMGSPISRAR